MHRAYLQTVEVTGQVTTGDGPVTASLRGCRHPETACGVKRYGDG